MDRRTFLKGTAFAGLGLAGLESSLLDRAASAVAATPRASYAGTTLTVITQTGPYIASAVQRFGPVWEKQTGER